MNREGSKLGSEGDWWGLEGGQRGQRSGYAPNKDYGHV